MSLLASIQIRATEAFVSITLISLAVATSLAHAANTWTGAGADNNWSTPANWDTNAVPASNSDITFSGSARLNINYDMPPASYLIKSMTFDTNAGTYVFNGNEMRVRGVRQTILTNKSSNTQTYNTNLTINYYSTGAESTITFPDGGGPIVLNGTTTYDRIWLFLSGSAGSAGSAGTLVLNGPGVDKGVTYTPYSVDIPTFTFRYNIADCILELGHPQALGEGGVQVNANGTLRAGVALTGDSAIPNGFVIGNANIFTIGGSNDIELSGNIYNAAGNRRLSITNTGETILSGTVCLSNDATARTLTLDIAQAAPPVRIDGPIVDSLVAPPTAATTASRLTKTSPGTLILSATNTYSGATTLSASGGSLYVDGAHVLAVLPDGTNVSGAYTLAAFTTLGGSGRIAPVATAATPASDNACITLAATATLCPGAFAPASPFDATMIDSARSTLTLSQTTSPTRPLLALANGATLHFSLGKGRTSTCLAITDRDGATSHAVTFNNNIVTLTDLANGSLSSGTHTLITADAPDAFSGLTTDADGNITNGLTLTNVNGSTITSTACDGSKLKLVSTPEGAAIIIDIAIDINPPAITSATRVNGAIGVPLSYQILATNITAATPATYALAASGASLPAGLALDAATGIISGTPAASGTITVSLIATGNGGDSAPHPLTFNIAPVAPTVVPQITSAPVATATTTAPFTYAITTAGTAFTYALAPGGAPLPDGLTLDPDTGVITGLLKAPGSSAITLIATNNIGTSTPHTLTIYGGEPPATNASDTLILGDTASEQQHALTATRSEVITGGLGETARRLLPLEPVSWNGGYISFILKIDPEKQNYLTVKLWGSDCGEARGRFILYIDGNKQAGYRHDGDHDVLNQCDEEPLHPNRFFYQTVALPPAHTNGKQQINLRIAALGSMWPYGEDFYTKQRDLTEPSRGLYRVYSHTDPHFIPDAASEKQGAPVANAPARPIGTGEEILAEMKTVVNNRLNGFLAGGGVTSNWEDAQARILLMAEAYDIPWTTAWQNDAAIDALVRFGDMYLVPGVIDINWICAGPLGEAVMRIGNNARLDARLAEQISLPKNFPFVPPDTTPSDEIVTMTRREAWTKVLQATVDFNRIRWRRSYTNQSMILDRNTYTANRGLRILAPELALPETQALRYLYESIGILPWLGNDLPGGGSEKPFGENYYLVTRKGLSRELGYVASYGETILKFARDMAELSGDPQILAQLIKISHARLYFRYPGIDADGYRLMRIASEIDTRTAHFPLSRGAYAVCNVREAWWMELPAFTKDPVTIGVTQQCLEDNQYFPRLVSRKSDGDTLGMMRNINEYTTFKTLPASDARLPMTDGQPDFVFSDEENAVLALKHGERRLFLNFYYRQEFGVSGAVRILDIAPAAMRIANVIAKFELDATGQTYKRPGYIDSNRVGGFNPPGETITQAWRDELLPIARRPDDATLPEYGKIGPFVGKASFYWLRYGDYLFGINTTDAQTFTLPVGDTGGLTQAKDLVTGNPVNLTQPVTVGPLATIVLHIPVPVPQITSAATASATAGSTFTHTVTASDTRCIFSAVGLPSGLTLNATTGVISGTPAASGAFTITLIASNSAGSTQNTLTLTVAPSQSPPPPPDTTYAHTALVTLAGQGRAPGNTNGLTTAARFNTPRAIAAHPNGNLYVADTANNALRRIDPQGNVTTLTTALASPRALIVANDGNLNLADTQLRRYDIATNTLTTLTAPGLETLATPRALAQDAGGNLYIANTPRHTILKLTASTTTATVFAGADNLPGSADGDHATARLNTPGALALSPDGHLYVADTGNNTLRKIAIATGSITTVATNFNAPEGIALDAAGNLLIANTQDHTLHRLDTITNTLTTLTGSATISGAADGIGIRARLDAPTGLAVDSLTGDIYVADTGNHTIRVLLDGPRILKHPASQTLAAGGTATLSVLAIGAPNPTYQWRRNGAAIAGATTFTHTIANAQPTHSGAYTVLVSNEMNTLTSNPAELAITATNSGTVTGTGSGTTTPPPTPGGNNDSGGNNNTGGGGGGGGGATSAWYPVLLPILLIGRRFMTKRQFMTK
jgi:autotransporter-associated beta strand protein